MKEKSAFLIFFSDPIIIIICGCWESENKIGAIGQKGETPTTWTVGRGKGKV